MTEGPRILTLDIETTPNKVYAWGLWEQNIGTNQIIEPSHLLCFAAKWLGERNTMFYSEWDQGRDVMAKYLHELLDEANVVIGYNSDRFDLTHINREFLEAGLANPSFYAKIDLLKIWRKQFNTPSNKLDYTSQVCGFGPKLVNEGMPLWIGCMEGDPASQRKMKAYNIHDVKITEKEYLFLRNGGWLVNVPNLAAFGDDELSCPYCGAGPDELQKKASKFTKAGIARFNYYCTNCRSHSTGSVDKDALRPLLKPQTA